MQKNLVMFQIEKQEIENLDVSRIHQLIEQINIINKGNPSQSAVLVFHGYNDILDEIYEIENIRKWVSQLFKEFPYILYYINSESEMKSADLLIACLSDVQSLYIGDKGDLLTSTEYFERGYDFKEIPQKILAINIKRNELVKITNSILEYGNEIGDKKGVLKIINELEQKYRK